jgi:hypothetical protein
MATKGLSFSLFSLFDYVLYMYIILMVLKSTRSFVLIFYTDTCNCHFCVNP